jgi:hypothetical protein
MSACFGRRELARKLRVLERVESAGKYGDSGILVPIVGIILRIQILAQR